MSADTFCGRHFSRRRARAHDGQFSLVACPFDMKTGTAMLV
jgi:hypothetical protein